MIKSQIIQQYTRRILAHSKNGCLFRSFETLEDANQPTPSRIQTVTDQKASEWMGEQKVFDIFAEDYAARLYLVDHVLGLEEAEKFFKSIPAEATFEKMRELGFLMKPSPFNSMISLYGQLKNRDMVENLVRETQEKKYSGVEPTSLAAKPTKLAKLAGLKPVIRWALWRELVNMASRSRLSREEKGKDIAAPSSPARDANGSPLDEFELIHQDALRDTENMSLSQRLLVDDVHRQFREEEEELLKRSRRTATFVGQTLVGSGYVVSRLELPEVSTAFPLYYGFGRRSFLLNLFLYLLVAVDWESRLPCVLGPRKSRLSLFTRKQQRLLNKARDMEGVPDLSVLLKGKLQLLSRKSTSVAPSGSTNSEGARVSGDGGASKSGASDSINEGIDAEPSASSPKKKKKSKKAKDKSVDETLPGDSTSLDATSDGSKTKKKKKIDATEAEPAARPKKKTKKKSTEAEPRPSPAGTDPSAVAIEDSATPGTSSGKRKSAPTEAGDSGHEPAGSERSAPDSSARRGSRSEGSLVKRGRIEFPDRVEFSYNEKTPLILNPLRCAELTRQIRGGSRELPQLDDLYFRNEYIDAASARKRSDGSMNFLVEKYDSALKQTMIQLGSAEKLAHARLKAIERVRAEHKKVNDKAAREKEILRVKFEELEGKLKSDRAAKKELASEKTRLEQLMSHPPTEHVEVLEKDALEECPEKENLDQIPEKDVLETGDTLVREEGNENAGTKDPVLVSDSSSEGQDGEEEEGDRAEETSPSPPNEVETVEEVEKENVPTRVEDSIAPSSEAPVDPPASRSEGGQDSAA
ncbi:hypothetical protein IGI04_034918 [Brassica rapa subsp. trilocularis]|uniref:Uncharacterized protein n=1 Tax=Brassica rapa subsp. trilocularis TaxID=1813537 RepID=A0ABQ7LA49_BRACM|nr:hypothetical protein IGI04_034918 [Brassica rapa subsp. trilocularis]